jgi:hypothetical protein
VVRTAGSVALCEISALDHEVLDDAVEFAAFVALAHGFLRQLLEVPDGFRDGVAEEADLDAADGLVADCDVEPNLVVGVYLRDNNRKEIDYLIGDFWPFLGFVLLAADRSAEGDQRTTQKYFPDHPCDASLRDKISALNDKNLWFALSQCLANSKRRIRRGHEIVVIGRLMSMPRKLNVKRQTPVKFYFLQNPLDPHFSMKNSITQ